MPHSGISATVDHLERYSNVDVAGPSLPVWISGTVTALDDVVDMVIAVALNGEIAAVTSTHLTDEGSLAYGALIPPEVLVDGDNEVQLLLVRSEGSSRTFHQIFG
jgi:hypothetical protein